MEILLTGGTGLIGRALCGPLLEAEHRLTVLSRRPERVEALCGKGVQALARLADWGPERHFDAVINLAGAPIVDRPWTSARRRVLWESRVTLTEDLVAAIGRAQGKPAVLLSGSAVGFYGDQGEALCSDALVESPLGHGMDFGGRLCAAWEAAARHAEDFGVRVCLLRTGLVLAREGGFYARLRPSFSLGLGARLGAGQQWMSWIHIDDYVVAVLRLLEDAQLRGAYNLTAPQPVRNAEFTRMLAASLHRPAVLVAPACLIRLGLGQRAYFLLGGQKVLPQRLGSAGFMFCHAELQSALAALAAH